MTISEGVAAPLWLGSGFHFALEDFHGFNKFNGARRAFRAYNRAFKGDQLPPDHEDQVELGEGMLKHYTRDWLPRRNEYQTLWVNGEPQVEVTVLIDITPLLPPQALKWLGDRGPVIYKVTFDRVVTDSEGRIWILDYKTAAKFETLNLETNPQVTTYDWAGRIFYERDIEGIIWQQFKKAVPKVPVPLVRGGFSQNKQQHTTYATYRRALIERYDKVPNAYREFLNYLADLETPDSDEFIRRDLIRRNASFAAAEQEKIVQEVTEMLRPGLPLYPNPTRDCSWDCPFRSPCLMKDDGSDYQDYLNDNYIQVQGYDDSWRNRIVWPEEVAA